MVYQKRVFPRVSPQGIQDLQKLVTKIEIEAAESLSVEDTRKVFESLDSLEEDLEDLSYIAEHEADIDEAIKDDPLASGKFLKEELPAALLTLVNGFRPFKIPEFKQYCQQLIEVHGYTKFQKAFDELLLGDKSLNSKQMRAMKHINRYLTHQMMDTVTAIASEGTIAYAQDFLKAVNTNHAQYLKEVREVARKDGFRKAAEEALSKIEREEEEKLKNVSGTVEEQNAQREQIRSEAAKKIVAIQEQDWETLPLTAYIDDKDVHLYYEKILNLAEKDEYKEAKDLAIKAVKKDRDLQLEEIKKQGLPQDRAEEVTKEADKKIAEIQQRATMPLDFYMEKALRQSLLDGDRKTALFQSYDQIMFFVLEDLMSRDSIKERTVVMERYLLMADQLIQDGRLDAAFPIFSALEQSSVHRLSKTKEGLSPRGQEALGIYKELSSTDKNFAALKAYIESNNTYSPLNYSVTETLFSLDSNATILDAEGNLVKGCRTLGGIEKVKADCQRAATMAPSNPKTASPIISKEIETHYSSVKGKTEAALTSYYNKSLVQEPRGNTLESSDVLSKARIKKLLYLGTIDAPKRSVHHHKIEEFIHDLKHGVLHQIERLKNFFVHSASKESKICSVMEEMQSKATSLFGNLLHNASQFFGTCKKHTQQFRTLLKEGLEQETGEEQKKEDSEGEHPTF